MLIPQTNVAKTQVQHQIAFRDIKETHFLSELSTFLKLMRNLFEDTHSRNLEYQFPF
jgi:hypothetical protein